jgi:short-subunit dehydrogenase
MFSTNVTGLINMTQAILPIFKSRPDGGHGDIINIGSIAGREPYQGGSIYCATKAAVRSFTDAMRKELVATRIRVIEIDPGQVETEFSVVRFGGDKEKAKKVYEGVEPLTPDDIADIVVFAAGRRENVVLADTLVFPNHQVSDERVLVGVWMCLLTIDRLLQRLCIEKLLGSDYHDRDCSYRYQSNVKTGTMTEYVTQKRQNISSTLKTRRVEV